MGNALLRLFVSDLVVAGGFVALQAGNAEEAMTVLESRPDVALLVTNVTMRGSMNGVELAHAVDKALAVGQNYRCICPTRTFGSRFAGEQSFSRQALS